MEDYKRKLELAKERYNSTTSKEEKEFIESLFPELKESENEKIRKDIIAFIERNKRPIAPVPSDDTLDRWIAWLEKQGEQKLCMIQWKGDNLKEVIGFTGKNNNFDKWFTSFEEYERYVHEHNNIFKLFNEDGSHYEVPVGAWIVKTPDGYNVASKAVLKQKPADKVDPKFKIGDWVVYNRDDSSREIIQVYDIIDGRYYFTYNIHFSWSIKECDEKSHLWTIQDAKDGDVLVYPDGTIALFKYRLDGLNSGIYMSHILLATNKIETCQSCAISKDLHPATKEQRDILFQKMKEAGYEWNAEKKKLNKIEQEPTDKIEPKFKVGDWVMLDRPVLITKVEDMPYNTHQYWTSDGKWFGDATKAKLWTIQDAEDGDVLATDDGGICVFDGTIEEGKYPFAHCGLTIYGFESYDGKLPFTHDDVHPATKEQRDLLFQKMKEIGYEWDAEKKELRAIEQSCYHNDGLYYAIDILEKTLGKVEGYQSDDGKMEHQIAIETVNALYHKKPAEWSEEDENIINGLLSLCEEAQDNFPQMSTEFSNIEELKDWFKSLKDKIQPQPKKDWSEKDIAMLDNCLGLIQEIDSTQEEQNWLKSIKDRVQPQLKQTQQNPAWSEEDEANMDAVWKACGQVYGVKYQSILGDWLKSLKDKIQPQPKQEWSEEDIEKMVKKRALSSGTTASEMTFYRQGIEDTIKSLKSQPHWKPSEEQMKWLKDVIDTVPMACRQQMPLESLYNDLKKL